MALPTFRPFRRLSTHAAASPRPWSICIATPPSAQDANPNPPKLAPKIASFRPKPNADQIPIIGRSQKKKWEGGTEIPHQNPILGPG